MEFNFLKMPNIHEVLKMKAVIWMKENLPKMKSLNLKKLSE